MESLGLRSLTKQTIATAGKSITGDGTPVDPLQLVNDEINPGNSEYYGKGCGQLLRVAKTK